MRSKEMMERIFAVFSGTYSKELGIDLSGQDKNQLFLWLVAAKFLGTRVTDDIAGNAFKKFIKNGLVTAEAIIKAPESDLVRILEAGGFARNVTTLARELKELSAAVIEEYDGDLNKLHDKTSDSLDLEKKLEQLPGVGPITIRVFLRELRELWKNAGTRPAHGTACSARRIGLTDVLAKNDADLQRVLDLLMDFWQEFPFEDKDFADLEVALLRLGRNYCLKGECINCELATYCNYYTSQR